MYKCTNVNETIKLGKQIGSCLRGSEVFELMSDLGGGKTTFVRGLAEGFGSPDPVASPSFTVSNVYGRPDGRELHHFDFYRLDDAGIVGHELAEVKGEKGIVIVVEWGAVVHNVLPSDRIMVNIERADNDKRIFHFQYSPTYAYIFKGIE